MRDPSSSRGDRVLDLSRLASRDRGRDRPRSSFLSLLLLLLLLLDEEWDLRLRLRCLRCFRCFRSFLSLLSRLSLFSLLLRLRLRLEDRDRESVRETDRCFRSFLSLLCRFSLFSLLLRLRLRLEERDRESVRETDRERPISFPRARTLCPPPQRRIVRRVDPLFANFREIGGHNSLSRSGTRRRQSRQSRGVAPRKSALSRSCELEFASRTPTRSVVTVRARGSTQSGFLGHFMAAAMAHEAAMGRNRNARLPPEVNRALYVRNLPFNITADEMYDIFGKYGAIRQIRLGDKRDTRGTAYVVYEDIYDAKNAVDHLSGFNVANRYLIVLYYNPAKTAKKRDAAKEEAELKALQAKYGVDGQSDRL